MGKFEEEQSLSSSEIAAIISIIPNENVDNTTCQNISKFVRFRCVIALLFSAAVFLSALFWLPPLFRYGNRADLDQNILFRGHDVVAMVKLQKPLSLLSGNISQLEFDIFEEIGVVNSTVNVILLDPSPRTNATNVVFAVDPVSKDTKISSASLSLLRASFVSLVINQSSLHLTPSLFGNDTSSFGVLKFRGGVTVIPQQSAFLLQKVQVLFNFTLNFSIHQIQENFDELKDQLKSGLHLNPYENLYVSLTNLYGSTLYPPTTVQASVLLTVGNLPPPLPRLKQLAQTITGSHARNLGLNNTVFGKVKQVSLSSVLQHSLDSSGASGSPAPSPSPLPRTTRHHHHHHHHHHHQHAQPPEQHQHPHPRRSFPVAPAPAPESNQAKPPSGCQNGHRKNKQVHLTPTVSPSYHASAPSPHVDPPAPAWHFHPTFSPLPAVVRAPVYPPSDRKPNEEPQPPDVMPEVSPSPSPISAGLLPSVRWSVALLLPLVAHLL
ncbi:hypothetical protein MKW94_004836 [Papaver nudicaule]|uniref:DUF7036 domain-containing protein n=1 Tax=Papaver nudicaule TaxID=74823 RepID=A0AA41UYZ8_PAPNU|nr:hypothetical protein [Papaver nudicaule]